MAAGFHDPHEIFNFSGGSALVSRGGSTVCMNYSTFLVPDDVKGRVMEENFSFETPLGTYESMFLCLLGCIHWNESSTECSFGLQPWKPKPVMHSE